MTSCDSGEEKTDHDSLSCQEAQLKLKLLCSLVLWIIRLHSEWSYSYNVDKRGTASDEEVLTSYTCDTLFCSRTEGRQSRRGNHTGRKMKGQREHPPPFHVDVQSVLIENVVSMCYIDVQCLHVLGCIAHEHLMPMSNEQALRAAGSC